MYPFAFNPIIDTVGFMSTILLLAFFVHSMFFPYLLSLNLFLLTACILIIDQVFLLLFMSCNLNDTGEHLGNIWILVSSFNGC